MFGSTHKCVRVEQRGACVSMPKEMLYYLFPVISWNQRNTMSFVRMCLLVVFFFFINFLLCPSFLSWVIIIYYLSVWLRECVPNACRQYFYNYIYSTGQVYYLLGEKKTMGQIELFFTHYLLLHNTYMAIWSNSSFACSFGEKRHHFYSEFEICLQISLLVVTQSS